MPTWLWIVIVVVAVIVVIAVVASVVRTKRSRALQESFGPEYDRVAADALIQEVMRARGYPVDDFDTRSADLSVDHPDVVEYYRAAHGIAVAHERGNAGTEELRHAVQHYRRLFDELIGEREAEAAA
jgi:hypothetical protein